MSEKKFYNHFSFFPAPQGHPLFRCPLIPLWPGTIQINPIARSLVRLLNMLWHSSVRFDAMIKACIGSRAAMLSKSVCTLLIPSPDVILLLSEGISKSPSAKSILAHPLSRVQLRGFPSSDNLCCQLRPQLRVPEQWSVLSYLPRLTSLALVSSFFLAPPQPSSLNSRPPND